MPSLAKFSSVARVILLKKSSFEFSCQYLGPLNTYIVSLLLRQLKAVIPESVKFIFLVSDCFEQIQRDYHLIRELEAKGQLYCVAEDESENLTAEARLTIS